MGKLAGFLAILSQSGKIELSFHPIAETKLTCHHIALQQMDMLRLQSLSNKRNEAFETMTNFIKKMQDNRNSIIGNMR